MRVEIVRHSFGSYSQMSRDLITLVLFPTTRGRSRPGSVPGRLSPTVDHRLSRLTLGLPLEHEEVRRVVRRLVKRRYVSRHHEG